MPSVVQVPPAIREELKLHTQQELAELYNVSRHVIYRWKRKIQDEDEMKALVTPEISFENGVWTALETLQETYEDTNTEVHDVDIRIHDTKPVMVVFLSDLHIGHISCDMRRLRHDLGVLKSTDGVYAILGGDLSDNVVTAVTSRGMHNEQLSPTKIQKMLVDELIEFLGPEKVLAMILGNHDEWSVSNDDFDLVQYLAKKIDAPYLGAWGYLNLLFGTEEYRVLAGHQFRMNSSFNKTHAAKRFMSLAGDADAAILGHRHDIAAETVKVQDERKFFAQAGSYLKTSRYGKRLGFGGSTPEMPGFIILPDKKKLIGIYDAFDPLEGIGYLTWLRSQY